MVCVPVFCDIYTNLLVAESLVRPLDMDQMNIRVLRPNRLKTIAIAVGSTLFATVGAWLVSAGESTGWGLAIFFGILALVFGVTALPNSSYLELRPDGFRVCSLFRSHNFLWSEVESFEVGEIGVQPMIVFNFSSSYQQSPRLRKVASNLAGSEGALPDSYGLPLSELAQLLNEYRNAYHAA